MSNENFFKHDDKAYAENLNDAILIANAFDYEVPVNIPSMYSNHHYPSNNNTYKAGGADVTIISSGSLSIGDEAITNNTNSSQMLRLRIYPNFNNFYAWKRLNWTCTGAVTVNICDAGTSTSLLPSGALTNPDNETLLNGISSLQGLKEYDLLITIPVNGVLNTLSLVFVNNWNSQNRVSASISQDNVTGLEDDLNNLNNNLNNMNNAKEDKTNKVTSLDNSDTHYPTAKAVKTQVDALSSRLIKVYNFQVAIENWGGQTGRVVTIREAPYYEGYSAFCVLTKAFAVTLSEFSVNSVYADLKVWNIRGSENSQTIKGKIIYYPSSWDE